MVTRGAVAKPNSSAPKMAAMATSRAAHQLTVGLDADFITQAVHDQGLMGLCQSQLPGKSGIVDGVSRCRTGTAVIAGYQDDLAPALATPAATVPTPASDTSFTEILAWVLAFFRS